MTAVGFNSPNMVVGGAGIMGPGRPPVSLEFTQIPFNCQGLPGPLGWMPTTGRPEVSENARHCFSLLVNAPCYCSCW